MNEQKSQNTNKNDEYELKRQQGLAEQKRSERRAAIKRIRPWIITGIVVLVIGFVGWWGIAKLSSQHAQMVASSSAGALAPDFTLPSTTGGTITLSSFRGKKNVLIYFNEGLSCDPCIQQIPELENKLADFDKMNIQIISVMLDPVDKLKETVAQYKITTPLLSYQDSNVEQVYNLLPFSMAMGRRAGHTFVLVDTNGKILWRKDYWPGSGMMVPGGLMFVKAPEIVTEVEQHLASSTTKTP